MVTAASFTDFQKLPSPINAAVGADVVGPLGFAAIGALDHGGGQGGVMGAALPAFHFALFSLWYCHYDTLSLR
jgi:hypothetical protein